MSKKEIPTDTEGKLQQLRNDISFSNFIQCKNLETSISSESLAIQGTQDEMY